VNSSAWIRADRALVPVTTVSTEKVKLHQVRENGSFYRVVRRVSAAASTIHTAAKPHVGTP
jgi:hypothetical protein